MNRNKKSNKNLVKYVHSPVKALTDGNMAKGRHWLY